MKNDNLKFRGYDTDECKMIENVGALDGVAVYYEDGWGGIVRNKDMEVMRFTGMKDKTGKDIYSNDIVKIELYDMHEKKEMMDGLWIVEDCIFEIALKPLQNVKAKIGIVNKDSFKASICHLCENDLLIIGNTHENKELLG